MRGCIGVACVRMHARGIPPGRNVASRKVVSHCPGGVRIGGDHRHLRCAEARERSGESAASPRRIHGKHYAAFRRGSGTLAASRRRDEREMARARRVRGRILHPRDELVGADAGRQVDGPPAHPLLRRVPGERRRRRRMDQLPAAVHAETLPCPRGKLAAA